MNQTDKITHAIQTHLTTDANAIGKTHAASAAHGLAWIDGELIYNQAHGLAQLTPAQRPLAAMPLFDMASVTKSLVTATLAMKAVDEGWLDWHTPISDVFEQWGKTNKDNGATLLHLLNHSSGLPAWHRFYEEYPLTGTIDALLAQRNTVIERILGWSRHEVAGAQYAYSDLGYILLCALLEKVYAIHTNTCRYLNELAHAYIFEPLDMHNTRYVTALRANGPDTQIPTQAVATEYCTYRQRVTVGQVHDENTMVMGGVSGHAGAFSTADDMLKFAQHMLAVDQGTLSDGIVSQKSLQFCWSEAARGADGHHLGGWDTPSGARTSVGRGFGRQSTVGHLGFTGTSLWIDRQARTIAILLTNRVHPTRENPLILDLRIAFHEAVLAPKT